MDILDRDFRGFEALLKKDKGRMWLFLELRTGRSGQK